MRQSSRHDSECALCRFMRGLAFGGLGAAVGGLGARWVGAEPTTWMVAALLGALVIGGLLERLLGGARERQGRQRP